MDQHETRLSHSLTTIPGYSLKPYDSIIYRLNIDFRTFATQNAARRQCAGTEMLSPMEERVGGHLLR